MTSKNVYAIPTLFNANSGTKPADSSYYFTEYFSLYSTIISSFKGPTIYVKSPVPLINMITLKNILEPILISPLILNSRV